MKRSVRISKKQGSAKRDLLWRKMRPAGRFLLLLTTGDAQARRQFRRHQLANEATELLVYRYKSGEVAHLDFRKFRYRGTLSRLVGRILSAHEGKSATSWDRDQASHLTTNLKGKPQ